MTTEHFGDLHVCSFTDFSDLVIETPDGETRFEFSKRFGPLLIGKSGRTIDRLPAQRDKFWAALHWWCVQGHRVERGRCVYDVPAAQPGQWSPDGKNFVYDTPENRAKWAAFVIPEREATIPADVWRLE